MAIRWETSGHVGVATIDRPERRNALDTEHCDALRAALADPGGVRVVVVTGAGSAFCAGADLGTRFENGHGEDRPIGHPETRRREEADPFHEVLQRLLDTVASHPLPVVAAVNGPALGAGTQLASVCDLRVAASDAVFGIPAVRLGIMVSAASTERLAALLGPARAAEMLLTGRRYDAGEARGIGLVHRVADDAIGEATAWAEEIAALAPLSVQGHKRALHLVTRATGLDAAARAEVATLVERAVLSEDLREGLQAFAERRAPHFRGR